MENIPVKFQVTDAAIATLADKYSGLEITDAQSYKVITAGIHEMRTLRVSVEKKRKELKADALAYGRRVDSEAKRITELLLPIEDGLKALKQTEDDRKAVIKAEEKRVEQERIDAIQAKIVALSPETSDMSQLLKMSALAIQKAQEELEAKEITIEEFQEFTPDAIKAKADKIKILQECYASRVQADAEAEQIKQLQAEQEAKKEAFRIEQERFENERLAKIEAQRIIDEKAREEQEAERNKILAEQQKIEAQQKAIKEEIRRLEDERLERKRLEREKQAKIEADELARIEAEKQAQAQIEKEKQEKMKKEKAEADEKARQETLRPDKEKLVTYFEAIVAAINAIEPPEVKTAEGKAISVYIAARIKKCLDTIRTKIEEN